MNIPKKIHYTWFSTDPFPEKVQRCIDSWKKHLSDYEFILWDYERVKNIDNLFMQQALQEEKWAFASDFVRLFAIYNEGGIYLDTDAMVYKSLNSFLDLPCFIGQENSFHLVGRELTSFLSSHCFGAEKNNRFIGECLKYYEESSFVRTQSNIPNDLKYDMTILPYIQAVIAKSMGWDWRYRNNEIFKHNDFTVFPSYYFDAEKVTDTTYCVHLALGSWRESRYKQQKITISYKIKWRIEHFTRKILYLFGYVMIKFK